jgi:uncharacterized protein (DUF169 family)
MNAFEKLHDVLMHELRLIHAPVAIKYFFDQQELDVFKQTQQYYSPVKPLTFCQSEVGARMEGITVLAEREKMGCTNASFVFGWKGLDEGEIKSHLKYCADADHARKVLEAKPQVTRPLLAIAVSPLAAASTQPDVVHFICDTMQAYHIIGDWMASQRIDNFHPSMSVNSAVCSGNVFTMNSKQANLFLACSGSYNSGKTERGEINVSIPGEHIEALVQRLEDRVTQKGGASITRLGEPFPGAAVCKNCPLIIFKKEHDA